MYSASEMNLSTENEYQVIYSLPADRIDIPFERSPTSHDSSLGLALGPPKMQISQRVGDGPQESLPNGI